LGDVAALQSLDGKHHLPEAALGRFSPTVTAGQMRTDTVRPATAEENLKLTQRGIGNVNRMAQFIHLPSSSRLR